MGRIFHFVARKNQEKKEVWINKLIVSIPKVELRVSSLLSLECQLRTFKIL